MQFVEEEFQIRNKDLHKQHCDYLDHPGMSESEKDHYSKVYGVNRTSILCEVPHFNVTEQLPQDLMHVLLEGVFHIHVNELLKYLVDTLSFMTLAEINHRIMSHPYAYFEEKPAPLRNLDPHGNQSGICMARDYYAYYYTCILISFSNVGIVQYFTIPYRQEISFL